MSLPATQTPARDLSPQEAEARAQRCFELAESVKSGIRAGREALWSTARALYEFDRESGYTALGYEKLGDWLADPEVGLTRSTYHRLVGTWRELVVRRGLPEGRLQALDVSKVDIVLPSVRAGTVALPAALDDVEAMGARDLREKYLRRPDADTVATPRKSNIPVVAGEECNACGMTDLHLADCMYANQPTLDGMGPDLAPDDGTWAATGHGHVQPSGREAVGSEVSTSTDLDIIEGRATEVGPDVETLRALVSHGREVLKQPQRLAGNRQAVRAALEQLIDAVEEVLP